MNVKILHRRTAAVLYSCHVPKGLSRSEALGAAIRKAIVAGISLRAADLAGADLRWANLAGADLAGADLAGANLAGANLAGANLTGADLAGAGLMMANLTMTNLTMANLTLAALARAYISRADFRQANFAGADCGDNRILDGGILSNGYRVFLWWDTSRGWRIRGGCWDVAIDAVEQLIREEGGPFEAERMAMLSNLRQMAKTRGWDLSVIVEEVGVKQ